MTRVTTYTIETSPNTTVINFDSPQELNGRNADLKKLDNHGMVVFQGGKLSVKYYDIEYHNKVQYTLVKSHIVLEKHSAIPQFECIMYDLLTILTSKPLPKVTLDDFFVGKYTNDLLLFGKVRYLLLPKPQTMNYFTKTSTTPDITMEDIKYIMEEIRLIVGTSERYKYFDEFIERIGSLKNRKEIENDSFYQRCSERRCFNKREVPNIGKKIKDLKAGGFGIVSLHESNDGITQLNETRKSVDLSRSWGRDEKKAFAKHIRSISQSPVTQIEKQEEPKPVETKPVEQKPLQQKPISTTLDPKVVKKEEPPKGRGRAPRGKQVQKKAAPNADDLMKDLEGLLVSTDGKGAALQMLKESKDVLLPPMGIDASTNPKKSLTNSVKKARGRGKKVETTPAKVSAPSTNLDDLLSLDTAKTTNDFDMSSLDLSAKSTSADSKASENARKIVAVKKFRSVMGIPQPGEDGYMSYVQYIREVGSTLTLYDQPNIVTVFGTIGELFEAKGMVMKFYEDGDLESFLIKNRAPGKSMLETNFIQSLLQIYDILTAALNLCQIQIVFRDYKLENVLLTKDKRCVLSDFGTAKTLPNNKEIGARNENKTSNQHTRVGKSTGVDSNTVVHSCYNVINDCLEVNDIFSVVFMIANFFDDAKGGQTLKAQYEEMFGIKIKQRGFQSADDVPDDIKFSISKEVSEGIVEKIVTDVLDMIKEKKSNIKTLELYISQMVVIMTDVLDHPDQATWFKLEEMREATVQALIASDVDSNEMKKLEELNPIISWKDVIVNGLQWFDTVWQDDLDTNQPFQRDEIDALLEKGTITQDVIILFVEFMKTLAFVSIERNDVDRLIDSFKYIQLMLSYHFLDIDYHQETIAIAEMLLLTARDMKGMYV